MSNLRFGGERQLFEHEIFAPSRTLRHCFSTYTPHRVAGEVQGIFVQMGAVSLIKGMKEELSPVKSPGTLAGDASLIDRELLKDRIAQAMLLAKRAGQKVAGISLDLQDFEDVIANYGYAACNSLLAVVAARINDAIREVDTMTRVGGDEFFVFLQGASSRAHVEMMGDRIRDVISKPVALGKYIVTPACIMGIAMVSPDACEPAQLLREADLALLNAKLLSRNPFVADL